MPAGHDDGLSRAHQVAYRRIDRGQKADWHRQSVIVPEFRGWDPNISPRGPYPWFARAGVAARLNLSGYTAATPATPSNGRLILCTVPASTAKLFGNDRTTTGSRPLLMETHSIQLT